MTATATVTRGEVALTVDVPDSQAKLVDALARAAAPHVRSSTRQCPGRLYLAPRAGTVAELAERCARWLTAKGAEVEIKDW